MPIIATVPPFGRFTPGGGLPVVVRTGTTVTTEQRTQIMAKAAVDGVKVVDYSGGQPVLSDDTGWRDISSIAGLDSNGDDIEDGAGLILVRRTPHLAEICIDPGLLGSQGWLQNVVGNDLPVGWETPIVATDLPDAMSAKVVIPLATDDNTSVQPIVIQGLTLGSAEMGNGQGYGSWVATGPVPVAPGVAAVLPFG